MIVAVRKFCFKNIYLSMLLLFAVLQFMLSVNSVIYLLLLLFVIVQIYNFLRFCEMLLTSKAAVKRICLTTGLGEVC